MSYNNRNKKYKVVNAKVNKQLINDELELEPITSKKPPILQLILQRLDKIDNRLDKVETTLNEHGQAINEIRGVLEKHDAMFKEHG
jgi:archaellum component FlaC